MMLKYQNWSDSHSKLTSRWTLPFSQGEGRKEYQNDRRKKTMVGRENGSNWGLCKEKPPEMYAIDKSTEMIDSNITHLINLSQEVDKAFKD